jgi:hypothetical protein
LVTSAEHAEKESDYTVEFTADGVNHTEDIIEGNNYFVDTSKWRVGYKREILYDPSRPETAMATPSLFSLLFAYFGALAFTIPFVGGIHRIFRRRKADDTGSHTDGIESIAMSF